MEKRNVKELVKRYIFFIVGLFVNSFGVSFITKASLGTSPISSIPYTLSLIYKPTLGMFTLYMSIVLIVVQIILLRKNFPKQYFLQIPVSIFFSLFIDMTMGLLHAMQPEQYGMKMLSLIVGCAILGFGVYMEVIADVVMLPGESFVNAVSITFHTDFGKTKVAFDSSMTVIAGVIGIIYSHRLLGVREGTIIAALFVGMIARFLKRKIGFVENIFYDTKMTKQSMAQTEGVQDERIAVVTVSREFGSNGRNIAKQVAEELGFHFYDMEITKRAALEEHVAEEYLSKMEQQITNSFLYDMVAQLYQNAKDGDPIEKTYNTEKKIMLDNAKKGNCVIVGRCADAVLDSEDELNCLNVYLHANEEFKIEMVSNRENISVLEASKKVRDINKKRKQHYKYFTGRNWGESRNYDLVLDSSRLSEKTIVSLICQAMKDKMVSNT